MAFQVCSKCNVAYSLNKDNFGHTPNGNFRKVCRQCVRKNVKEHSLNNPEMVKNRQLNRKLLEDNMRNKVDYKSNVLRKTLYDIQQGLCFYCKTPLKIECSELDHMVPLIKGGHDNPQNLALSCFTCNREKHNKTIEEYRDWKAKRGYEVLF